MVANINEIQSAAATLLNEGKVKLVLGYRVRGNDRVPAFVTQADQVGCLAYDSACKQNLAAYLRKGEVRSRMPVAVVARPEVMRSLMLLTAESQIAEGQVTVLAVDEQGFHGVLDLAGTAKLLSEQYARIAPDSSLVDQLAKIEAMTPQERSAFWSEQFEPCTRCYACRAACPGCFCERCIVEMNTPQWISTAAESHGNFAWHMIRAFHQAGRCVECGACQDACPQGIPLMLLNHFIAREVEREFDARSGYDPQAEPVIGSWKQDDKQEYIR